MSANTAARLAGLLLIAASMTACSGDSDTDSDAGADSGAGSTSATPTDEAPPPESTGENTATVTLEGTTYEFADDGGPANFCTSVGPTLQATLALVADSAGGEGNINVFLVQSDADLDADLAADNQPYVDLELPTGQYTSGASSLASVVPEPPAPVEIDVSGKTASGTVTFTVLGTGEVVDGEIELSCA
ncbi:hypothetical protein [Nocardioides sp.]|uniref:hypothetical protein n=1 Tax=Nocardioides sp. TaxID=35761 RepID=UPI003562586C